MLKGFSIFGAGLDFYYRIVFFIIGLLSIIYRHHTFCNELFERNSESDNRFRNNVLYESFRKQD
jgi:hypothetical protein